MLPYWVKGWRGADVLCAITYHKRLAFSGSRRASSRGLEIARVAGQWCAQHEITVITGGANGVDRQVMNGAYDKGGDIIIVLAQGINTYPWHFPRNKELLESRSVLFLSPFKDDDPWTVERAMERNQYILQLSDYRSVFIPECATSGSGGTWDAAMKAKQMSMFIGIPPIIPESPAAMSDLAFIHGAKQLLGKTLSDQMKQLLQS